MKLKVLNALNLNTLLIVVLIVYLKIILNKCTSATSTSNGGGGGSGGGPITNNNNNGLINNNNKQISGPATLNGNDLTMVAVDKKKLMKHSRNHISHHHHHPFYNNILERALLSKSKVDILSGIFKNRVLKLRQKSKRVDLVFLIDSSSSVGKNNFQSELKFVKKMLSDFNVSYNYTKVAIVTFSSQGKVIRHVDHISSTKEDNDKCKLLNYELPKINYVGGGTYTYGALREARDIFSKARKHSRKLICLITDGFSNGKNPVPIAQKLKQNNITIVTFGIQTGNYAELYNISSSPGEEHTFLLDSFNQFESLARKALHSDYKMGSYITLKNISSCNILCDKKKDLMNDSDGSCCDTNATCMCGTTSGHYSCTCNPGYYGSGLKNNCELCPNGTYWQNWNFCKPCSDANHIILDTPATNSSFCVCKKGYKQNETGKCTIITCPDLQPPINGYFVKHPAECENVLNAACGSRCKSGYQLTGSSIRLCQQDGTWSGNIANCILKTCPSLKIPYYGMAVCKNDDLNLALDYSPRNETFMSNYDKDEWRVTEQMPIDTDCNFKCGPGFYMVGSSNRNCLPLSRWDGLQTLCKQILCAPLPKPTVFGEYFPLTCSEKKIDHGIRCNLICPPGFIVKGPEMKICGGKRSGVWSNKNKTPKCVDNEAPALICPKNYMIQLLNDNNFANCSNIPEPIVFDNSNLTVTYWLKPTVKSEGVRLPLGEHMFSYIAVDSFKNKAKCNFTITVIDGTPPTIDNCIDPPVFRIPSCSTSVAAITATPKLNVIDNSSCYIEWDDPIIYDNSNTKVFVNQSIWPGFHSVGKHKVKYLAVDSSGNENSCQMNITVEQLKCDILQSPQNGVTMCAKNLTHTWCEVTCDTGYGIYDVVEDNIFENFNLICDNNFAKWKYERIPDCTIMEQPDSIEQVFSIDMNTDSALCNDDNNSEKYAELKKNLTNQIRQELCGSSENCEIVSTIPDCPIDNGNIDDTTRDSTTLINNYNGQNNNNSNSKTFYNIVQKRDVSSVQQHMNRSNNNNRTRLRNRSNVKIRLFTKISKKMGLWNRAIPRSENLKIVKAELRNLQANDMLHRKLNELKITMKLSILEELAVCKNGSISKKFTCIQCGRGTFHNITSNTCQMCSVGTFSQMPGKTICSPCPENYSTRKSGSQSPADCKQKCPPGTMARLKLPKNNNNRSKQKLQKTLYPFCRKCSTGEYQPLYDQSECQKCPEHLTSIRGAKTLNDCFQRRELDICLRQPAICGPHGVCQPEKWHLDLYSCLCEEGYLGAHCEHQLNHCLSAPCQNGGTCIQMNSLSASCICPDQYTGKFCETHIDLCDAITCRNDGVCVEINGKPICECIENYEGEFCEKIHDNCASHPCEKGKCLNTAEGYICQCPPGIIGRRCHLQPCDYLPCHSNAICENQLVFPASRNSYTCRCPTGLKGYDCLQIDSPCDFNPCRNNGKCTPVAVRQFGGKIHSPDDTIYQQFTCKCPPYFYGQYCETLTTPDFVMEFNTSRTTDFVKLNGPTRDLNEVSVCAWIQTNDNFNYGTILSYATEDSDNMFTMTDYNGLVIYINGSNIISDITFNDGKWHFICVSWTNKQGFYEIYIDGQLHQTGYNLSTNNVIKANGTLIIGQDQDSEGSSFSESESFIGKIAYLDVWDRFLATREVLEFYTSCEPNQGNLYGWSDFKSHIYGNVKILESPFCKTCSTELTTSNGYIKFLGSKAFYYCNDGYRLHSFSGYSSRDCLRTSEWSLPEPICKSITCESLPDITNGQSELHKKENGETIFYTCNDGYSLNGSESRHCLGNGTWSGTAPQCTSNILCKLVNITEANIIYTNEQGNEITFSNSTMDINSIGMVPVGISAEIQCLNDTYLINGEHILTCLDTGTWDYIIPICVEKSAENLTLLNYEIGVVVGGGGSSGGGDGDDDGGGDDNDNEEQTSTENYINYDNYFWKELKKLYYFGCTKNNNNITTTTTMADDGNRSELCTTEFDIGDSFSNYSDLTNFEIPIQTEFQNMYEKLLNLLMNRNDELLAAQCNGQNVTNIFHFILFGGYGELELNNDTTTSAKKSYRLILCFIIDEIIIDNDFFIPTTTSITNITINNNKIQDNNITEQIKILLKDIFSKFYSIKQLKQIKVNCGDDHQDLILSPSSPASISITTNNNNNNSTTNMTSMLILNEEKAKVSAEPINECELKKLPTLPVNSIITEISLNGKKIIYNIKTVTEYSIFVPISTRVYVKCVDNYYPVEPWLNNINPAFFICTIDGKWIDIQLNCILL